MSGPPSAPCGLGTAGRDLTGVKNGGPGDKKKWLPGRVQLTDEALILKQDGSSKVPVRLPRPAITGVKSAKTKDGFMMKVATGDGGSQLETVLNFALEDSEAAAGLKASLLEIRPAITAAGDIASGVYPIPPHPAASPGLGRARQITCRSYMGWRWCRHRKLATPAGDRRQCRRVRRRFPSILAIHP